MKRVLSRFNQTSRGQVESVVMDTFSKESAKLSYALGWMNKLIFIKSYVNDYILGPPAEGDPEAFTRRRIRT